MRSLTVPCLALALLLAPAAARPLGAQAVDGVRPSLAPAVPSAVIPEPTSHAARLSRVDAYMDGMEPRASLEAARALLAADPDDYDALWRATRAAVVLGTMEDDEDRQNAWFEDGSTTGERAAALRPDGIDGLYWLAAAKGRLALQQGPRTTAVLAQEVSDLAHRVLALDPHHAGAHDILGKLNYEVMTLTPVERFLARVVLRKEALKTASWEKAESHLDQAVAAAPEVVLFRYDQARMYLALERWDEARSALEALAALPVAYPPDARWKAEGRSLLAELDRRASGG